MLAGIILILWDCGIRIFDVIAVALTSQAVVCGIAGAVIVGGIVFVAIVNPFGLGDNVLFPIILFVALTANDIYMNLRYNERWIKSHTKDEIVERYGEFDIYEGNTGYYKILEINSYMFDTVKIVFDDDGMVRSVDMDYRYARKGG